MRWGLVAMLMVAGCGESQYGAYFVIEGDVAIDHVELYFGTPTDSSGPGSGNEFATPSFGPQSGLVFDRVFDASDIAMSAPGVETTVYVPATDANRKLGAYVAVVAFNGDKPVGIAEYFDFSVPSDEVHKYLLKLEPWGEQLAERWGGTPDASRGNVRAPIAPASSRSFTPTIEIAMISIAHSTATTCARRERRCVTSTKRCARRRARSVA